MRAIILAAGRGTRLRPLTNIIPKPLLTVGNRPLISYLIQSLVRAGIKEIIINIFHLAKQIKATLRDGYELGANIQYSDESETGLLGTAGAIIKALPLLGENFLVVSGDIWTEYPFIHLVTHNMPKNISGHLVMVDNPFFHKEGDFNLSKNNYLTLSANNKLCYANIGLFRAEFFKEQPENIFLELGPILRSKIVEQQLTGEHYKGSWENIGTEKQLVILNNNYLNLSKEA